MFQYISKVFKSTWQLFTLFFLILVIAVTYILAKHTMATTTDARVVTNVIPIASSVSGVVSHINVKDNQFVKRGQSLFELRADDLRLQVIHGEARIAVLTQTISAIEKDIHNAEMELARRQVKRDDTEKGFEEGKKFLETGEINRTQLDKVEARMKKAQIRYDELAHNIDLLKAKMAEKQVVLKEAQATYNTAKKQMSQLVVTAPVSGYISNFNLHEGTVVKSYHTLFGIIQPAPVWVIANFLETELVRIRPGQPARVRINMYPDIEYEGEVESIGYGITPDNDSPLSSVLPTVAPNYSWIRLSQRFPVKIRLHNPDPNTPMRVGANARVKIYTDR